MFAAIGKLCAVLAFARPIFLHFPVLINDSAGRSRSAKAGHEKKSFKTNNIRKFLTFHSFVIPGAIRTYSDATADISALGLLVARFLGNCWVVGAITAALFAFVSAGAADEFRRRRRRIGFIRKALRKHSHARTPCSAMKNKFRWQKLCCKNV